MLRARRGIFACSVGEVDSEVLAPRVAALVYLLGGILALIVTRVVPDFHGDPSIRWNRKHRGRCSA